jgi:hypothetical protein
MRRRLTGLVAVLTAVVTVAGCGITSTGVVGFGTVPSGAATVQTSVPKGDTAYQVYFQIGGYLEAETRVTKSGLPTELLYRWLLAQIATGPNAGELERGFSPPDAALSQIQMTQFQPGEVAETIMLNLTNSLSGNDEGQIICTLNGENLGTSANDAFGIVYLNGRNVNWNNCGDFPISGSGMITASPS